MLLKNRFRLIKQLARGGFSATYLAEDTHMLSRRHCVVKQLQPQIPNQACYAIALQKFQEEAALLEQLKHDQIPQLYGYFEQEGGLFLIQEWVNGPTLGEKVRTLGPLSTEEVQQMLLRVLPVLEYLHRYRVIHRDIKPDNLILRQVDSLPVLIDFGSMKHSLQSQRRGAGGVADSVVIGTAGFMAPEQAAQRAVYSSDLYSLGMSAIYALTAKLPMEMETTYETGQLQWRQYAPQVSDRLAHILNTATEVSPQDRFKTAKAMLDALRQPHRYGAATVLSEPSISGPSISGPSISGHAQPSIHTRPTVLIPADEPGPHQPTPQESPQHQWFKVLSGAPSAIMAFLIAGGLGVAIALSVQGLRPQAVEANPDLDTGQSLVQTAHTFSAQGKELEAIRTLLKVPATSDYAQEAHQEFANLIHINWGQPIDRELDAINIDQPPGHTKRSLAGIGVSYTSEIESQTQVTKVQTKFGSSPIEVYRSNWPVHRQPTDADLVADPTSWDNPWSEHYEITPGITLEVMYGCESNKVLQTTETFDRKQLEDTLITARFQRILRGSHPDDIQFAQTTLKQLLNQTDPDSTATFTTDQVRGWIKSTPNQLRIVTRKR